MSNSELFYCDSFVNYKNATPESVYIEVRTFIDQYTTGQTLNTDFEVHYVDSALADVVLKKEQYDIYLNGSIVKEEYKFESKGHYELKVKYKELVSEPLTISVVNKGNPYLYLIILFVCILAISFLGIFIKKKRSEA